MRTTATSLRLGGAPNQAIGTGVLATLRGLAPSRMLTARESLQIAERQAARLRELTGLTDDLAFPIETLESLPRLHLSYVEGLPVSGLSRWQGQMWRIAVAAGDPLGRQRFTALHEFKHIIDHTHQPFLPEGMAERVADHFAGCLLMPKRLVTRLWGQGVQDVEVLAEQFEVSPAAMAVRLSQIGLRRRARCPEGQLPTIRPSLAGASAPGSKPWS